jgi:hypothetical protein
VVSFTPLPLYHGGNSPCYPLDMRLGGPPSRSERGGVEKNSQPPQIFFSYYRQTLLYIIAIEATYVFTNVSVSH